MTTKKKFDDYETAVARLEEITTLLESSDTGLEDAIKLYTEGLEIARFCDQKLTVAEKKIKVIMEKRGQLVEEEFDSGEEQA